MHENSQYAPLSYGDTVLLADTDSQGKALIITLILNIYLAFKGKQYLVVGKYISD